MRRQFVIPASVYVRFLNCFFFFFFNEEVNNPLSSWKVFWKLVI